MQERPATAGARNPGPGERRSPREQKSARPQTTRANSSAIALPWPKILHLSRLAPWLKKTRADMHVLVAARPRRDRAQPQMEGGYRECRLFRRSAPDIVSERRRRRVGVRGLRPACVRRNKNEESRRPEAKPEIARRRKRPPQTRK